MDTPRARSPRPPLPPLSSKPTAPLPPPPPPLSAAASPSSHDFAFYSVSSSRFGGHLHSLSPMSRAPVGRAGSDLSHTSYSKASTRHPTTTYGGSKDDREQAKNRTPSFFSGLGVSWRKESGGGGDTTGGRKLAEEKRKDKAKRALDLGQWVKKYMTALVEQLRSSLYRQAEREPRRRPHSFSVHGPNAAREMKERERWMRRRAHLSSAPASLRVSPANSGHLSVKVSTTSSEESTMEELQSAIEAAIAHCKNSISRAQQADDGRRGDRTKQLQ